jgi:hypothetical protein
MKTQSLRGEGKMRQALALAKTSVFMQQRAALGGSGCRPTTCSSTEVLEKAF